jgi:hypothetical protein
MFLETCVYLLTKFYFLSNLKQKFSYCIEPIFGKSLYGCFTVRNTQWIPELYVIAHLYSFFPNLSIWEQIYETEMRYVVKGKGMCPFLLTWTVIFAQTFKNAEY